MVNFSRSFFVATFVALVSVATANAVVYGPVATTAPVASPSVSPKPTSTPVAVASPAPSVAPTAPPVASCPLNADDAELNADFDEAEQEDSTLAMAHGPEDAVTLSDSAVCAVDTSSGWGLRCQ